MWNQMGVFISGIATAFLLVAAAPGLAPGQMKPAGLPSFILIAVNPAGALLNTLGTGLAKMIGEKAPFDVKLRTTSGYTDSLANDGSVHLAMSVSVESHQSSHGLEHYSGQAQKKIRLIASGPPLVAGIIVKKDSPYQSVADLKGKRVTGKFPGTKPVYWDGVAMFAAVNMKWEDVIVVPVGNIVEGVQTFIQGRTEATVVAAATGLVQEADAALKGVRFLTLPGGADTARKMWNAIPGFYPFPAKAGFALGVDRDMVLAGKDIYVISGTETDPSIAYEVTKAMWNQMETLQGVHPFFKVWTRPVMLKANVTIPYHEGAIRFYKEVDKWTPEMDQVQQNLLQALK